MHRNITPEDDPREFDRLPKEVQAQLLAFIPRHYTPARSVYRGQSSYGMKHLFARWKSGSYVTNGAFKGAMLAAGFRPEDTSALNWYFFCRPIQQCGALTQTGRRCQHGVIPGMALCPEHHYTPHRPAICPEVVVDDCGFYGWRAAASAE